MKVLHVDPALSWRGGERQVYLLARELARRGHASPVVAPPGSPLAQRAREAGLPILPLAIRGDLDPGAISRLARWFREEEPDVVHLHTSRAHGAGGLAARLTGFRPVVVTRRLELPVRGIASRWKYRALADHFVAISGAVEDALTRAGVPDTKITRIPSGVEIPSRVPAPDPARPWTVGTLAAFTPQKDPDTWVRTVIRVCQSDPETRFVWAGEGELARRVEVGIERAGLAGRVSLPGFVRDVEAFWAGIDAFFLPSAFEALGTVFLDALARGVPVVATSVGGIPETVRNGREGLLRSSGDVEGLASALLGLQRDPERAREMGQAGRLRARDFEIGSVVDRIFELYEKLVHNRKGKTP